MISISSFSQNTASLDKKVIARMNYVRKYRPDFHKDSVKVVYPIYNALIKKKFRKNRFSQIPTYKQIEKYIDFKHPYLDLILARTSTEMWCIAGKTVKHYPICYTSDTNNYFFNYIDSVKPDRIYFLNGDARYLIIEKSGYRYLSSAINGHYQKCDIADIDNLEDFYSIVFSNPNQYHLLSICVHVNTNFLNLSGSNHTNRTTAQDNSNGITKYHYTYKNTPRDYDLSLLGEKYDNNQMMATVAYTTSDTPLPICEYSTVVRNDWYGGGKHQIITSITVADPACGKRKCSTKVKRFSIIFYSCPKSVHADL